MSGSRRVEGRKVEKRYAIVSCGPLSDGPRLEYTTDDPEAVALIERTLTSGTLADRGRLVYGGCIQCEPQWGDPRGRNAGVREGTEIERSTSV